MREPCTVTQYGLWAGSVGKAAWNHRCVVPRADWMSDSAEGAALQSSKPAPAHIRSQLRRIEVPS